MTIITCTGYRTILHDHVAYRYEVLKILGRGSFGEVVKAYDHKNGYFVAIKIVRNTPTDNKQVQTEIRILKDLRNQKSCLKSGIIGLLDNFLFRNHACLVFEMGSISLSEALRRNGQFDLKLVRKFAYSIVSALVLLHRKNIIHSDIKPDNILLKEPGRSKTVLIDFGTSCYENELIYDYIQTRFYRAPEVTLGKQYGMEIDMWSLGCLLPELLTGQVLFPGENSFDHLGVIMELLGMPPTEVLAGAKYRSTHFDKKDQPLYCQIDCRKGAGKPTTSGHGFSSNGHPRYPPGTRDLSTKIGTVDAKFVDFVKKCLAWEPSERLTPMDALKHPWLCHASSSGFN